MGCAVSNTQALCKAIGVENDKAGGGVVSVARSKMNNQQTDTGTALADVGKANSDLIGNMDTTHGFTHRMATLENDLVQTGRDTIAGITDKGKETMTNAIDGVTDLCETAENKLTSEAQGLAKSGAAAVNNMTQQIEDEVKVVSESIHEKMDDMFNLGDDKKEESLNESKEDIGDKIDEILALSIEEIEAEKR